MSRFCRRVSVTEDILIVFKIWMILWIHVGSLYWFRYRIYEKANLNFVEEEAVLAVDISVKWFIFYLQSVRLELKKLIICAGFLIFVTPEGYFPLIEREEILLGWVRWLIAW